MLGATDMLTKAGIAIGSEAITKAGILGNSAVKAVQQMRATKDLKGADKTNAIAGAAGGFADAADKILFGD
jgi:hypothetical protein